MPLNFHPPLLNSANAWATTKEDLQALYDCPHTGALTTRTATINGFNHDDSKHQYCFFESQTHQIVHHKSSSEPRSNNPTTTTKTTASEPISSLNTLGYSPISLPSYLNMISTIIRSSTRVPPKPIIFSVTGTPTEISHSYNLISTLQSTLARDQTIPSAPRFLMEINLSCPNIPGKPPPAYCKPELLHYLETLSAQQQSPDHLDKSHVVSAVTVGIKTPPYTHQTQFDELIAALLASASKPTSEGHQQCPIAFITATNTLGSSLLLSPPSSQTSNDKTPQPALMSSSGTGIGGLAGAALHPLALGNVATLRRMLDAHLQLRDVEIIGVGGVSDAEGFERMVSVGAVAVGVGTAFGVDGVGCFGRILGRGDEGRGEMG